MAQQSVRPGRGNQGFPQCLEHASGDLDLVRELPYKAGGCLPAASEAGQMTASDHAPRQAVRFPLPRGGRPQMESRPWAPDSDPRGCARTVSVMPPTSRDRPLADANNRCVYLPG